MSRRIRTIKPEVLLQDQVAADLSDGAWRLWVGVRMLADDWGSFRAGARYLASQVWGDAARTKRVEGYLAELQVAKKIALYESEGHPFGVIVRWDVEQRCDNRSESTRLPIPPEEIQALTARVAATVASSIDLTTESAVRTRGRAARAVRPPEGDLDHGSGSGEDPDRAGARAIAEPRTYVIPDCYATAYAKGVERGSGAPVAKPSSRGDTDRLLQIVQAHARDASGRETADTAAVCAWLEASAEAFARSTDERGNRPKLAVWAFETWTNERHRGPAVRPGVQRGQAWTPRNRLAEATNDSPKD